MEIQHDPVEEDAVGEPVRVSPRLLWFIGLLLAVLLAGGGYVVAEHIMTSKAIEQLGRSVAHGVPPAVAPRTPAAAVRPVPPAAPPAPQPQGDWIGGDADLAAETSGSSRAAGDTAQPGGALRVSGGAEPVDGRGGAEAQGGFDTAGSSGAGAAGGARAPAAQEEGSRSRRARAPGYDVELERHYSTVFARCPRPGVPGAVECRRAVCAGAARKTAACRYYADGRD
ncbi:hypothetical protein [Pseudoduganella rhizocola]|uniref:hypothetical protein n=1 Tax=Pseudoduganella rhizocola TaxID=3382643 RepID=UPI0038B460D4